MVQPLAPADGRAAAAQQFLGDFGRYFGDFCGFHDEYRRSISAILAARAA
jgi:hypothetical protein